MRPSNSSSRPLRRTRTCLFSKTPNRRSKRLDGLFLFGMELKPALFAQIPRELKQVIRGKIKIHLAVRVGHGANDKQKLPALKIGFPFFHHSGKTSHSTMGIIMKKFVYAAVIATIICSTGCVSRTITEEAKFTNPKTKNQYGGNHTKMIDKKLVWFWQDEFSNP